MPIIPFIPGEVVVVIGQDGRRKYKAKVVEDRGPPHFVEIQTFLGTQRGTNTIHRSSLKRDR